MKRLRGGLVGLALAALLAAPAAAHAAASCNGLLLIDYVSHVGNTVGVRITLGTGDILGGTKLTIDQLQFNLDCDSNFPLVPPCTDEGPVVEYEGDGTISTTCPVSWSTGHPVGTDPNVVVFTASPDLDIPADQPTPPGFCTLDFDVKIVGPDTDGSGLIDELVGYQVAHCDNGILDSGGFQTADLPTTSTTTTTTTTTTTSTTTSTTTTTTSTTTTSTTTTSTTTSTTSTTSTTTTTTSTTTTTTTSTTTTSTTTSTTSTTSTTTTTTSTTTTTTAQLFTRTVGFWKNRPTLTSTFLPLTICGETITNVAIDDAHSALEALCGPDGGIQRFQCCRQLMAAALNAAAGGASFADFATCNATCGNPNSSDADVTACKDAAEAVNLSGDNIATPFPEGSADPDPCKAAAATDCLIIDPAACAVQ